MISKRIPGRSAVVVGAVMVFAFFFQALLLVPAANGQAATEELVSGWYVRPPFQMEVRQGDLHVLTGLDIMVARELFSGTGYRPTFKPMSWGEGLKGLKDGTVDFIPGGFRLPEREKYAHYSIPYRMESTVLYYRAGESKLAELETIQELFDLLRKEPYRMAYTEGFAFGSAQVMEFFENPPPTLTTLSTSGYTKNLNLMLSGSIDFFIACPAVMDRMLLKHNMQNVVHKGDVTLSNNETHFLFSKKTVSPDQVELFNDSLEEMKKEGTLQRIHIDTILPFYIGVTTNKPWFQLVTMLGIVAFSLSGVLLARREHYNIFGALVLGTLPAIGGGVLRDIILGANRIFVLKTPLFFLTPIAVVVVAFLGFKLMDGIHDRSPALARIFKRNASSRFNGVFGHLFHFFDAWAVAAFTVIGVSAAIEMRSTPLWLWGPAMGVLTASGGVVLRDMVRADFNIEMLKKDSYAEVSILGGLLYTGTLIQFPDQFSAGYNAIITIAIIFLLFTLRFLTLWYGWENPFQFGSRQGRPELRLAEIREKEPELWRLVGDFHAGETEKSISRTIPSAAKLEFIHNQFFCSVLRLRIKLDELAAEPLDERKVQEHHRISARVDLLTRLEEILFDILCEEEKHQAAGKKLLPAKIHRHVNEIIRLVRKAAGDFSPDALISFHELHDLLEKECHRLHREQAPESDGPDQFHVIRMAFQVERLGFILREYMRTVLADAGKNTSLLSTAVN